MRDVLLPLAAENSALIIGSACRDASLMMMFGRLAKALECKYSRNGMLPWTMLGFVAAPKLTTAVKASDSVAAGWFKISKRWQARAEKIEVLETNLDLSFFNVSCACMCKCMRVYVNMIRIDLCVCVCVYLGVSVCVCIGCKNFGHTFEPPGQGARKQT